MMKGYGRHRIIRWAVVLFVLAGAASTSRAVNLVQEFYLPIPEAQIRLACTAVESSVGTNFESIFSIVVSADATVIYYDQWEDGYEIDLSQPTQATTRIWGDGIDANGIPPGFAHDPVGLATGTVLTLRNTIPLPRNPANLFYDGRDRLRANKALVISRAGWPTPPGSVFGGSVAVPATIDYGTNYISPVGQDMTNGLFQYVGLFVMASDDGTSVTIDPDGSGPTASITTTLNRGESYLLNGGVKKGGSVLATKPVQVNLVAGHINAHYAMDWFTLYPVDQWSNRYYTPVGSSATGNPTFIYFYNPSTSPITINFTNLVGAGSFVVPGTNGVRQYQMPPNSGASFASANGATFFALCTVGANPSSDAAYNWGFTLLPKGGLTTEAVVGWGPGNSDGTQNGSPVWVTPLAATRVYVEYNGDHNGPLPDPLGNKYDTNFDLAPLQSKTIYDPDKDQTAMRLYTVDGTLITAAWGEDPSVAAPGLPYIDAGTPVFPFPVPVLKKTSILYTDNNTPGLSVGDVLQYTVELDNKGLLPLGNVVAIDGPPASLAYVANSTTLNGSPLADSPSGTAFPLDSPGYTIPILLRGGSSIFTYRATIVSSGVISNSASSATYRIEADNVLSPPPAGGSTACSLSFADSGGTPVSSYAAGSSLYVKLTDGDANTSSNTVQVISIVVSNLTHGDFETIALSETGTNTGVFLNTSGLASSVSAGLGLQDGTLNVAPGDLLSVARIDPSFGDTCSATALVQTPSQNKVLYLSADGSGSPDQDLDRID